jgi:hypothetical protein
MPPLSLIRLNAVSIPTFIWLPSSLAEPVNGAEIPSRISLSVTPRVVEALSVALRADAMLAKSSPLGSVDAMAG